MPANSTSLYSARVKGTSHTEHAELRLLHLRVPPITEMRESFGALSPCLFQPMRQIDAVRAQRLDEIVAI
jgi:hypothetical protein